MLEPERALLLAKTQVPSQFLMVRKARRVIITVDGTCARPKRSQKPVAFLAFLEVVSFIAVGVLPSNIAVFP